jgi:hypothetical protein
MCNRRTPSVRQFGVAPMRLPRCEATVTVINAVDWLLVRYVPTLSCFRSAADAVRCTRSVASLSFEYPGARAG